MEGNYVIDGFKALGDWTKTFYEKNKAHIFTGLGIGGTIATGILSAKDGMKAARKIDAKENELRRPLNWKEKLQLTWKDYIDASLVCSMACFSEFKSDQINTRTIADRTALLIASEKAYEKLAKKTKEVLGEKKAAQVKDEIAKEDVKQYVSDDKLKDAPKVGNGQLYPFMDGYSKILFWSNIDYLQLCVLKLQGMMKELKPRGDEYDYNDKKIGVSYSEWLSYIGAPKDEFDTPERRDKGWNRGFDPNGEDDDVIAFTTSAIEYSPGFAVTVINWEKEPTDMKLGRLIKSSGW